MTDREGATDRVAGLRADIARASTALSTLVAAYAAPDGPLTAIDPATIRDGRLLLVGMGSSRFAADDAGVALRGSGVAAATVSPSEAIDAPAKDLTLVAISASGKTVEVVEIARRHHGTSQVIAVTDRPGSPLAEVADVALPLLVGEEASGISTLTYRATVAVLRWVADRICGTTWAPSDLTPAIDALAGTQRTPEIQAATDLLDGAPAIDVLAPGPRFGAASQAALMLREAPRLPAHAYETADWLHTGVYLALPGHRVVLLSGSPSDGEIVEVVRRRGGEVIAIGGAVNGAAVHLPVATATGYHDLVESAVVDLLAAELWERATASG